MGRRQQHGPQCASWSAAGCGNTASGKAALANCGSAASSKAVLANNSNSAPNNNNYYPIEFYNTV